jgi:2-dehydro-3-deoxyphosphogluconate aldolase/(4S)-4-hydroxy-2-oxoglutarate aldolase
MNEVIKQLGLAGLLPVIKIDKVEDALPLSEALLKGNLPVAEVTFRTAAAEKAIETIAKANTKMLLGAGTVLTTEQADRAIGAGAKYIVSPGFNPVVVEHCLKKGVSVTPGVTNPSLVEQAMAMGLEVLKFFPAEQSGGLEMLKTFSTVYPNAKFIPTGGVSIKNLSAYAKTANVHAVGGTWMVTADLINGKQWDKITALALEAVNTLHSFHVAHIGFNANTESNASSLTAQLASLFAMKTIDGNSSSFVSNLGENQFEIMKSP